ncbi:HlyD family secretion protein [Gluconacetobacter sp. Hr-1-5]|uniref:HlyD family secretion protein n=1 Tax=Gluconacetobacter sp. Hr-1-5 TaxID=3395370 RepID=UPI003B5250ED
MQQVKYWNAMPEPIDTPPAASKSGKKRRVIMALLCVAVLGGVAFGVHWWTVGRFLEATDDAYVGGDTTPISPHVSGFVARILIKDNQFVQAGQTLLILDDRDYQAAADKARAALQEKEATLGVLLARKARLVIAVTQIAAELEGRLARAIYTSQNSTRYRGLAARSASPVQGAQQALSEDRIAKASVDATKAALAGARQELTVIDAQIVEARASIGQAEADLRQARLNVSYTTIRAPIDGYIGNRAAQTGAYVSSGTYLLSVVPSHGLWIDANFKEDQLTNMKLGQPAEVEADVLPGHRFHGHVLSLAPGTGAIFSVIPPENATGNFTKIVQRVPVRILLDGEDATLGKIRPGLSTEVTVDTKASGTAVHE